MERKVYEIEAWFETESDEEAQELQSRIEELICDFKQERGQKLNYGIVGDYMTEEKAAEELKWWNE